MYLLNIPAIIKKCQNADGVMKIGDTDIVRDYFLYIGRKK